MTIHEPPTEAHGSRSLTAGGSRLKPGPLLDGAGAAELLNVPESWVRAQVRADRIPHRRFGKYVRFDQAELLEWSAAQHRGPVVTPNSSAGRS